MIAGNEKLWPTEAQAKKLSSGKIVTITSLLEGESLERFRDMVDAIQSSVPKSAWADKDDARRDYQEGAEK